MSKAWIFVGVALVVIFADAYGADPGDHRYLFQSTKEPITAPLNRNVPGVRIELAPKRELYVPEFFDPELTPGETQIVVYFHGAAWCAEQNFYDAGKNAVLLSINSDYESMGEELPGLLNRSREVLTERGIASAPLGRLCIASFSGGYSAVREILRNQELTERISDVVLADSLYAPKLSDTEMAPEGMQPFLHYALRASEGGGTFLFSHLYPHEAQYRTNTTTLAADYLINQVGASKVEVSETNNRGAILAYRADKGGFHVFGFLGMTTQDHFEHLYSLDDLLRQTSLKSVPSR